MGSFQIFPPVGPTALNITFPNPQNVTVVNPVEVEGIDANGALHVISTDTSGNIQISAQDLLNLLKILVEEVRALRLATVANTCDGGRYNEQDFDPAYITGSFEFSN